MAITLNIKYRANSISSIKGPTKCFNTLDLLRLKTPEDVFVLQNQVIKQRHSITGKPVKIFGLLLMKYIIYWNNIRILAVAFLLVRRK